MYVADNSTAGTLQCRGNKGGRNYDKSITQDCFIQTIQLYQIIRGMPDKVINTFIINNTAESGSALYGGLLDRCTVNAYAEIYDDELAGLQYINKTVMISKGSTIASDPVQVIFCGKQTQDTVVARKGKPFKVCVSAINQVGSSVSAVIHSSVVTESGVGRLKERQAEQRVDNKCTELEYTVFSQDSSAQVELYADGPCANLGISKQTFKVAFIPCICPIGFQSSELQTECECVCDQELQSHQISNCSQESGIIELETNIWIGVAVYNNETNYIIHDCPFDYCIQKPSNINLNSTLERDKQCAFNRIGVLCGKCQEGFSHVYWLPQTVENVQILTYFY